MSWDSKPLKIVKNVYSKANVAVKGQNEISQAVDITNGVLQEEVLSLTLFTLFIADLKLFLKSEDIRGMSIDHLKEILLLAYAYDLPMIL